MLGVYPHTNVSNTMNKLQMCKLAFAVVMVNNRAVTGPSKVCYYDPCYT